MQRDLDLIRSILLKIESNDRDQSDEWFSLEGEDESAVSYNLELLVEAGFVEALRNIDLGTPFPHFVRTRLTWTGHEYLDQVRDPKIWRKTKAASSKLGGVALPMIADIAKGYIKVELKKHGVDI